MPNKHQRNKQQRKHCNLLTTVCVALMMQDNDTPPASHQVTGDAARADWTLNPTLCSGQAT